jgi:trimethylamine--corrinoid protein Co-methyltransferase
LVLGNENISMAKRFIRGITINPETLAREAIEKVGPGGHFLQEMHTLQHFKDELWVPELMTRDPREVWIDNGSKSLDAVIQDKLHEIIETHKVRELDAEKLEAVRKIKEKGEKLMLKS